LKFWILSCIENIQKKNYRIGWFVPPFLTHSRDRSSGVCEPIYAQNSCLVRFFLAWKWTFGVCATIMNFPKL